MIPDWSENDIVLISALEHWSYCPRQCALIHMEQTYDENVFTLRGNRAHRRVHDEGASVEHGATAVRGMTLWSDRLGLYGKADVVEFRPSRNNDGDPITVPFPVEHKSGRDRPGGHDALQLCAQALCLEEMYGCPVPEGDIAYHGTHRRRTVAFDDDLRARVVEVIALVRANLRGHALPPAVNDRRCPPCSLFDACLPDLAARPARVRGFQSALFRVDDDSL